MADRDEIQRIDIAEFRRDGYLQEINRRLLHPLGLALEVTVVDDAVHAAVAERLHRFLCRVDRDDPARLAEELAAELYPGGSEYLSGCWDYRDDPEGIHFGGHVDPEKAKRIDELLTSRAPAREQALGHLIEPPKPERPSPMAYETRS